MRRATFFVVTVLWVFSACVSTGGDADRQPGENETVVIIQRNEMPIYSGFKERIYIDGKQRLLLPNGGQGRIMVPNGTHTIHASLYTLISEKTTFSANSGTIGLMITPYSIYDFAIEDLDEDILMAAIQNVPAPEAAVSPQPAAVAQAPSRPAEQESPPEPAAASSRPAPSVPQTASLQGSPARNTGKASSVPAVPAGGTAIENSLLRAAEKIMVKIPQGTRMAIVYVTARDGEIAEFIANELEFIMLERDLILIDRSNLDNIRKEQNFQLSGEVDDNHAVSIGKMAGAEVILIGAVTGSGDIRRLRLRALNTQSAQVVAAASERY
jgi:hypothetical protein